MSLLELVEVEAEDSESCKETLYLICKTRC